MPNLGGAKAQTWDLVQARQTLYQLSYTPASFLSFVVVVVCLLVLAKAVVKLEQWQ